MHLINALAAGVNGAEDGSVFLYRRGTSTLVSYYTDFEATAALTQSSSGIALDGNGGVTVYVDTLVNVVVKSSVGITVRTFVAGDKDSSVEVISTGFTGTDYVTGATGASKPTVLQSVLDKWFTSAGTTDFNVLLGGAATSLQNAVKGVEGFFYNVKANAYGATGDGTTDDYASIAAAVSAANAAGGGIVLFPPGTYRTTDELSIPYKVSLMGCGPEVTQIRLDSAASADNALYFAGTASTHYHYQELSGLRLTCAQANTKAAIAVLDAHLMVRNVEIIGANDGFSDVLVRVLNSSPTGFHIITDRCFFQPASDSLGHCIDTASASSSGRFEMSGCTVKTLGTSFTQYLIDMAGTSSWLSVRNCYFDVSAATSGCAGVIAYSEGDMIITGNYFKGPASGTGLLMDLTGVATSGGIARESGNVTDGAGVSLYTTLLAAVMDQWSLESRTFNYKDTSTTAASVTLSPLNYGTELIQKTSGATLTINATTAAVPLGHRYTLTIWNDVAGVLAVTMGTGIKGTGFNVAANSFATLDFVSRAGPAGTIYLYQIGTPRDEAE